MLKDVLDGLKLVGDGIDSIKTIAEAIKSGKEYVRAKHPEIRGDLHAMIQELSKSLLLIKRASSVLTNFRFAVDIDVSGTELVRFNDYFIQAKTESQHLRDHIDDLRTHCSKIREHSLRISESATADGFAKLFTMLGLNSPEREKQLASLLDRLAFEDFAVANSAVEMLDCLEKALNDVQNALGDRSAMFTQNVPLARTLLIEYGPGFERMEELASAEVKYIRELAMTLR